jgi:hypothetical protein
MHMQPVTSMQLADTNISYHLDDHCKRQATPDSQMVGRHQYFVSHLGDQYKTHIQCATIIQYSAHYTVLHMTDKLHTCGIICAAGVAAGSALKNTR